MTTEPRKVDVVLLDAEWDELPATITVVREAAFPDRDSFPCGVDVEVTMRDVADRGLPSERELTALRSINEQLEQALGAREVAPMVYRITWNGTQTTHFRAGAVADVRQRLAGLRLDRSWNFEVKEDPEWADPQEMWDYLRLNTHRAP